MNGLIVYLSGPTAGALVMTLIHTLWQGCIIAAILWLSLRMISTQKEGRRYAVSLGALIVLVSCGFLTFSVLRYTPPAQRQSESVITMEQPPAVSTTITPAANPIQQTNTVSPRISWIFYGLCLWTCGVLCMMIRLGILLADQSRLKLYCHPVTDPAIIAVFEEIKSALQVPMRIQLVVCSKISIPAVMGFFEPVLLLPASVLTGIQPDMLKAILAHELAHIRRYDYLINLFQMILESLLFFNPAVWWINRQIRLEREACCDIAGATVVGKQTDYAQLLLNWILLSLNPAASSPQGTPAFSQDKHQTLERARRMLTPGYRPQAHLSWTKWTLVLGFSLATILGLWKTADATVALAAKIMTPVEILNKMEHLIKKDSKTSELMVNKSSQPDPNEQVIIEGIIVASDSNNIPSSINLDIRGEGRVNYSYCFWIKRDNDMHIHNNQFHFSKQVHSGESILYVYADGYAPKRIGPLRLKTSQINTIENIILNKGFSLPLHIIDQEQKPIVDVKIEGLFRFPTQEETRKKIDAFSNSDGYCSIPFLTNGFLDIKLSAKGFETRYIKSLKVSPEPVVIILDKIEPIRGQVISRNNQKSIPGVQIWQTESDLTYRNTRSSDTVIATTDNNGFFEISDIRSGYTYSFRFSADGFVDKVVENVLPGQVIPVELILSKPLDIYFYGNLNQLPQENGGPVVYYSNNSIIGLIHQSSGYKPLLVNQKDDKWHAHIDNVSASIANISCGDFELLIPCQEDGFKPVVVNMTEKNLPEYTPEMSKTTFIFDESEHDNNIKHLGKMKILYSYEYQQQTIFYLKSLDIVNGKAESMLPATCQLWLLKKNLIGYGIRTNHYDQMPLEKSDSIHIPAFKAGFIHGNVINSAGNPTAYTLSLLHGKSTANTASIDYFDPVIRPNPGSTQYTIYPVPIGFEGNLLAYKDFSFFLSEPVRITLLEPLHELNITISSGDDYTVQLVDPNNNPVYGVNLEFNCRIGNWSCALSFATDRNGEFVFHNFNRSFQGDYYIEKKFEKDYQPVKVKLPINTNRCVLKLQKGAN